MDEPTPTADPRQPVQPPSPTEIAAHWFRQAQLGPLLTPTDRSRLVLGVGAIVEFVQHELHVRLGVPEGVEVPADFYRWLLGLGTQQISMGYASVCAQLQARAQARAQQAPQAQEGAPGGTDFNFAGAGDAPSAGAAGAAAAGGPAAAAGAADRPAESQPHLGGAGAVEDQPLDG